MAEINTNTILSTLEEWVRDKKMIDAHTWVDASQKLNVLIGEEHDKLYTLEQSIATAKVTYLDCGKSVAEAKTRVEATDTYKEMMKQRSKIKQIEELIKIAKLQARLKDNEIRNY